MDAVARTRTLTRLAEHEHVATLVVLARGSLVAAHSLGDRQLDEPAELFSATKSVLGTVTLLAVKDGHLTLDTTLGDLLGTRVPAERRVARVRDLLAMTGGAHCPGSGHIDRVMTLPGGWVDALLAEPQAHPSGQVFRYDNGATHLLSAGLHAAVGDLADYAGDRLFAPAGIGAFEWPADPDGVPWGFAGIRVSAMDLAVLGEAWRTDVWGLGPLLAEATTAHSEGGDPEPLPYGWLFWIDEIVGRRAFLAAGWAGQYVLVVPDAGLTLVITGDPARLTGGYGGQGLPVIRDLAAEMMNS